MWGVCVGMACGDQRRGRACSTVINAHVAFVVFHPPVQPIHILPYTHAHRWHGKAGLVLYDLSMLTVATGLLKSLHPSAVTLGMLALLCMLW